MRAYDVYLSGLIVQIGKQEKKVNNIGTIGQCMHGFYRNASVG